MGNSRGCPLCTAACKPANSRTSHHVISDWLGQMILWWQAWVFLRTNVIRLVLRNKLTVRCCRQWLVSPTGRSGGRRDVWRTAQTHEAFDQQHPSMRTLPACALEKIKYASSTSSWFTSLNTASPYYWANERLMAWAETAWPWQGHFLILS